MHRYFPHTPADEARMLEAIGVEKTEDLFRSVPPSCRRQRPIDLPAMSEWDLTAEAERLAASMPGSGAAWVGAGSYDHYVPAIVPALMSRSEFVTAYTPYQPEISQGTLQGIFEYQTLVARLLDMDVANASMYDGATALAEAALMAVRLTKRRAVAVSKGIHPHYRQVLATYCGAAGVDMTEMPLKADGTTDLSGIDPARMAGALIQSPNFFGIVEPLQAQGDLLHASKSLLVVGFTEAMAYGLLKGPGASGADIVAGEGQSLGLARSFGGPNLGIMATRKAYVRNIPGRLVGRSLDNQGRVAYVLTLSTREQHIRREKAVSNICSNAGLCALTAGCYLATMGGTGLSHMAKLNRDKAAYLKAGLEGIGFRPLFGGRFFNEFAMTAPDGFGARHAALLRKGVLFGLPVRELGYAEDAYLFCVTETRSKAEIDAIVKEVSE